LEREKMNKREKSRERYKRKRDPVIKTKQSQEDARLALGGHRGGPEGHRQVQLNPPKEMAGAVEGILQIQKYKRDERTAKI
jgi:hypothetical protein